MTQQYYTTKAYCVKKIISRNLSALEFSTGSNLSSLSLEVKRCNKCRGFNTNCTDYEPDENYDIGDYKKYNGR